MRNFVLIVICAMLAVSSLGAKQKGKGNQGKGFKHEDDRGGKGGKREVYTHFRVEDVREIHGYYQSRSSGLPKGLEKKLRRQGRLPPGWEKKLMPFPVELEHRMPPLGPGLCRGIIEGQAVIYNERTRVILDVAVLLGGH
jgi:hypothetical protein